MAAPHINDGRTIAFKMAAKYQLPGADDIFIA
jgi:hypothetical protein